MIAVGIALVIFNVWMSRRWVDALPKLHDYCRSLVGSPSLSCLDGGDRFAEFVDYTVPRWVAAV
jgi:hypothetical protein